MNLEQLWTDLQQEIKEILGVNKYEIWVQKGDEVKLQLVDSGDTWILLKPTTTILQNMSKSTFGIIIRTVFGYLWTSHRV